METLKIFISGTQDDLQPERRSVADAIGALGHEPVMAETYGTQPIPSISTIREMIDCADIYIGVYGARYGWTMDNGVSVTEFEFDEFRRKHSDRILTYIKEIQPESEQAAFLARVQDFKEGYFRRPKFTTPEQLANWVKQDLAQFIARVVRDKMRGAPEPALIRAYLEQVAAQKPYVLWSGQIYIDRTVAKSDDLFARTVARYDPREFERAGTRPTPTEKSEPLDAALAREKRLVLLGEPGMGKTTSLLHLAWQAAQRGNGEIPVYVELKYYDGEELETLLARRVNDILRARSMTLAPDLTESTRILKEWLAQTDAHFLLLLDGLNEVRPEHHTAARGALDALLNSPHRVVISCRERDYDASLRDRAAAFVLRGLQEDEIQDYLQNTLGDKGAKLFDEQIHWDEKMRTLAANPLMLWLISVVARQDPKVRLPANRGKLFQRFVRMMPQIRRREVPANVPLDVVETALAKLGLEMQERGRLLADLGEVRDWQVPTVGSTLEDVLAQAKDWRFLKSDGRLGEPVEFLYQLFLEYFAAEYLRQRLAEKADYARVLGGRLFRDEWNEVIVMLAGISDRPVQFVKWLAGRTEKNDQVMAAFLAQDCWKTSDASKNAKARVAVVDALITAFLLYPHQSVCKRAAEALVEIGDARAVEPLIMALLQDSRWYVRRSAAKVLGALGDARAVQPLIAALRDSEGDVRFRAVVALWQIGTPAVEPLITTLRDRAKDVRASAASILGLIGDARGVEPLLTTLHDRNKLVREKAADALGLIGDVRASEPLIAALHDPVVTMRKSAIDALGVVSGARAVEPLLAALRDVDASVRSSAVKALGKTGDARAVEALLATLRDANTEMRRSTAWALGEISDARAVEPLLTALRDTDAEMRRSAGEALGKIGDARVVEPLIAALCDTDSSVRESVVEALGRISDARAIESLITALRDEDVFVHERAAWALGEIGDARALQELDRVAREDEGKGWVGKFGEPAVSVTEVEREAAEKIRKRMTSSR